MHVQERIMGLRNRLATRFTERTDLAVPGRTPVRLLTVEDGGRRETWVQEGRSRPRDASGNARTMVPHVEGGILEGDIVATACNSTACIFIQSASGLASTLLDSAANHRWTPRKAAIGHVGIVTRDPGGQLSVVHQPGPGQVDPEVKANMTRAQRWFKANLLTEEPLDRFFAQPHRAMVLRPTDRPRALAAAHKARRLLETQVDAADPKRPRHAWFFALPHRVAPDHRGGFCSGLLNLVFGELFKVPYHMATPPDAIVRSPEVAIVGDRAVVDVRPMPTRQAS